MTNAVGKLIKITIAARLHHHVLNVRFLVFGPPPQEHELLSYSSTRTKAPSVIISGLKPATWYIFSVRTRTPAGYSSYSPKYEYKTTGDCKFFFCSSTRCFSPSNACVCAQRLKGANVGEHQLRSINKYPQTINTLPHSERSLSFTLFIVSRGPSTPHQIKLHAGCTKPCARLIFLLLLIVLTHQRLLSFTLTQHESSSPTLSTILDNLQSIALTSYCRWNSC